MAVALSLFVGPLGAQVSPSRSPSPSITTLPDIATVLGLRAQYNSNNPGLKFSTPDGKVLLTTSVLGYTAGVPSSALATVATVRTNTTVSGRPAAVYNTTFVGTDAVLQHTNVIADTGMLLFSFAGVDYTMPKSATKFNIRLTTGTLGSFVFNYTFETGAAIKRIRSVGPSNHFLDWYIETSSNVIVSLSTFDVAVVGQSQTQTPITVTAQRNMSNSRQVTFSFTFPYFAVGPLTYEATIFVGKYSSSSSSSGSSSSGDMTPGETAGVVVPFLLAFLAAVAAGGALIWWKLKNRDASQRRRTAGSAPFNQFTKQHENDLFSPDKPAYDLNKGNWSTA
jgi:hypothetical protein